MISLVQMKSINLFLGGLLTVTKRLYYFVLKEMFIEIGFREV